MMELNIFFTTLLAQAFTFFWRTGLPTLVLPTAQNLNKHALLQENAFCTNPASSSTSVVEIVAVAMPLSVKAERVQTLS